MGNRKRKKKDDNKDDFEKLPKKKCPFSNRNKLSKKRLSKGKVIKVEQFKNSKPGDLDDYLQEVIATKTQILESRLHECWL